MILTAPWTVSPIALTKDEEKWVFRTPNIDDGDQVHNLISLCPPLDMNSSYCNFLQSTHFKQTCIIAECNDEIAGFISGYLKPDNKNELFIWQVAVAPDYRGKGVAFNMLKELMMRDNLEQVEVIETTITKANQSSWGLFRKVDKANGSKGSVTTFLDKSKHFKEKHDTEYLYRIPLTKIH